MNAEFPETNDWVIYEKKTARDGLFSGFICRVCVGKGSSFYICDVSANSRGFDLGCCPEDRVNSK